MPAFHLYLPYVYTEGAEESSLSFLEKSVLHTLWKISGTLAPFCSVLSTNRSGIRAGTEPNFCLPLLDRMHERIRKVACFNRLSTTQQTVLPAASLDNAIRFRFKSLWGCMFEPGLRNGVGVWHGKPYLTGTWMNCFVDANLSNCQVLLWGILCNLFLQGQCCHCLLPFR